MKHVVALIILVLTCAPVAGRDVTVAADGSGDFKSVQQAVDSTAAHSGERVVIRIKPGTYHEKILVAADKPPITFVGDDAKTTILSYEDTAYSRDSNGDLLGTFLSASTRIDSDDFRAQNITFENARPKGGGQALAISVSSDRAAFENCRFLGWQDTMYLDRGRQFFDNCYIAGNTDFIFGGATAFFESCEIRIRSGGFLTAASTPENQPFGFVFHRCHVTADSESDKTFLGRPWRPFASVAFIDCDLPATIRPEGWNNWSDKSREKTARFAEYNNHGPGAAIDKRAAWAKQLTEAEAGKFTVENVLAGPDAWNPRTGDHQKLAAAPTTTESEKTVYLITSFRGNGEDGLHLAWSDDGYKWHEIPGSFIKPEVGGKLMRDPSICRTRDGTFHMVWTSGWEEKGFGYASSKDLIHWSDQKSIEIMKDEPTTVNVWAPEIRYEESRRNFMIYWSSTIPGRFPGDDDHPKHWNHRIYYTNTPDFQEFSKPKILLDPGYSAIDGIIIDRPDGRFALVFKDERRAMLRLRVAFGTILYGPYGNISDPITDSGAEGPTCLKIGDQYVVYFDKYQAHKYGAIETTDFKHWSDVSSKVDFPFPQRHGTAFIVPATILTGLQNR